MRKALAGSMSGGALLTAAVASPAMAAPSERACANPQPHGTERAHTTVPHRTAGNDQAHASIPHYCGHH